MYHKTHPLFSFPFSACTPFPKMVSGIQSNSHVSNCSRSFTINSIPQRLPMACRKKDLWLFSMVFKALGSEWPHFYLLLCTTSTPFLPSSTQAFLAGPAVSQGCSIPGLCRPLLVPLPWHAVVLDQIATHANSRPHLAPVYAEISAAHKSSSDQPTPNSTPSPFVPVRFILLQSPHYHLLWMLVARLPFLEYASTFGQPLLSTQNKAWNTVRAH